MTVLTTIQNGSSNKDIRDTINGALVDIQALKQGGGSTPTPTPVPTPTVYLSTSQAKAEGNAGPTLFTFTVTRSSAVGAVNVSWLFAAGSTSADDFTGGAYPTGGIVPMSDGQASGQFTISVNGDTVTEADETFTVSIGVPSGYAAGTSMSATGTIQNDDSAFVAPTLAAPLYADDFTAPAGTSSLAGRANWSAQDASFGAFEVKDGYLHRTGQYDASSSAFFGGSLGDHVATFGYSTVDGNGDAWEESRQWFHLYYQDANSFVRVFISKGLSRLSIIPVINGNFQNEQFFGGVAFKDKGEIRLTVRDGKFRAMVDGKWIPVASNRYGYPIDTVDQTGTLAAAKRSGRAGVTASLWRYPVLEYITVDPLKVAIDSVDEFVGRDSLTATGGSTKVAMTMAAGANPQSWVYRLLTPGTLAEVKAFAPMANVSVNGSAATAFAFVPTGGPYIVQAGYVDASDGKARVDLSLPVLSGIRGETWGQSNSNYRQGPVDGSDAALNTRTPWAAVTLRGIIAGAPASGWSTATNAYQPTGMHECARVLSQLLGKPVGIGAQGNDSTALYFNSPGQGGWQKYVDALASRRGIVEFWIGDQGEGDADSAANPTYWANDFNNNVLPGLRTISNNPQAPMFFSPVGRFASTGDVPYADLGAVQNDLQRNTMQEQYRLATTLDPRVFIGDYKLGTEHNGNDAYHYSNRKLGYAEMGRRAAYSIAKYFGVNVPDGRGALATSATRSGALIDVTFDLNGGTAITGPTSFATGNVPPATKQGKLGYQVSADNFATTLAISDVTLVSGKLRIALAADPGGPVKVRSMYGWSYDDTVLFYTTYADGRAPIPAAPIIAAIAAA
ncbi:hypothetical protein LPN01_09755 [Sphingomonas sp. A2-49]|uniref:hypothetical protein n=1 Tax=Sphingomonas sp. A2-49 TaxID=1391375 RepID=UPI0021D3E371|nr:hypothetical protein [Sphingomonas sp. A2-49]MCU6454364.1 hypothetical protein [Sphingomonas sp. A2-49]